MRHTIIITEFMDENAVARLGHVHDVLYDPTLVDDPARLGSLLVDSRALIVRNKTQVNASLLAHAPALEIVGRLGVGLDNIDLDACDARGISVFPATGANAAAVAEYVIAALLILRRGAAFRLTDSVIDGDWPRAKGMGGEVSGATLGLLGYGMIARETARRARALGLRIIAHDPALTVEPDDQTELVDLETLIATADVLSLHVPLTEATHGLLDSARLNAMKPGAILINTARGGVVNENDLMAALMSGHLGGAALDVFEEEPLSERSDWRNVPGLLLTPHIAGVTRESNVRVSDMIADVVLDALT